MRKKWEESLFYYQRGFTLIELLVVMMIISMLAAFVGPKIFKKLDKAKYQAAAGQIHLFEMALDSYRLDIGEYPNSLDDLVRNSGADNWDGPYLKKGVPKDPWGGEYSYRKEGDDYSLSASKQIEETDSGTRMINEPG